MMVNIIEVRSLIITPTLDYIATFAGSPVRSSEAEYMLLVIGQVESGYRTRAQSPAGHANGFWQFEKEGGCWEFEKEAKLDLFRRMAKQLGFTAGRVHTWNAIGFGADHLACLMARAILMLEPAPLPRIGDIEGSYRQYLSRWRPGRPSKERFISSYETVTEIYPI